jgi:hypothetical protein
MSNATYPLEEIKRLVSRGLCVIIQSALDDALLLGFDDQDICDCIYDCLNETHFYKTMTAEKRRGFMQDVYRITYGTHPIYLKLQIADKRAVVISFKAE